MVCMTDVDAASNIIMSSIDSPYLFVLDPHNHQFYIPDFVSHLSDVTVDIVIQFLDDISDRKVQVRSFSSFEIIILSSCHTTAGLLMIIRENNFKVLFLSMLVRQNNNKVLFTNRSF